ncbi:MAG: GNAT family N-acetyltransferase [Chloroflexi bacterium]|jgi:GNAT superfamily N-acetyltransferase|nr:GNAT family N-acetyltransferase [Chloroflexota bacterium]
MTLSIETYRQDFLEGMVALYNAETVDEPHIAPLDPQRFVELIERKPAFDPGGLFVAVEQGRVVGWTHACVTPGTEPWSDAVKPVPRIVMLLYARDQLKIGHALVSQATAWLRQHKQGLCLAMSPLMGYPFYRGLWLGGEPMGVATMPHIQLAFATSGYRSTCESLLMAAELREPVAMPRAEVPLELVESPANMAHAPMRDSWLGFEPFMARAYVRDEEAGYVGWVLLPQVAERLGAPCVSIWGLSVQEKHRRQGIGAALVGLALQRGYALGARFASVTTQLWNAPAQATYARLGYRPYRLLLGRTLQQGR